PDPPLAPTPHTLADAHAYTFTDGATHHGADRARVAQRGRRGGDTGSAAERRGARAPDRRRRRGRGRRARRAGVRARAALLALDTENRVRDAFGGLDGGGAHLRRAPRAAAGRARGDSDDRGEGLRVPAEHG